jgi:archaellin
MLTKAAAGVWTGNCVASGTATFYRLGAVSDTSAASSVALRIQGTVGLAGADLNVTSTTFTNGEEKRIDYYVIGMLTS